MGELPLAVPLNKLTFWVQIYGVPIGFFTERVGMILGNFIGRFLEYDGSNKGAVWKTYMHIRVEVDVLVPLKRKKKLKLGNSRSAVVNFKYEKLRTFCFLCGMLDHTESRCEKLFNAVDRIVEKGWGPELKAPDRFGRVLDGDRWLKHNLDNLEGEEAETFGHETATENQENDVSVINHLSNVGGKTGNSGRGALRESLGQVMSTSMTYNPIFATGQTSEVAEEDDLGLLEARKRKCMNSVSDNSLALAPVTTMTHAEFGEDVNHFLTVAPIGGDHREQ